MLRNQRVFLFLVAFVLALLVEISADIKAEQPKPKPKYGKKGGVLLLTVTKKEI